MKFLPILVAVGLCFDIVNGKVETIREAQVYGADSPIKQDQSERGLSLQSKWNIDRPDFQYNALQFDLTYNISDFVKDANIRYRVFDGHGCQEENEDITNSNNYLSSQIVYDSTPLGDGNGFRRTDVTLNINPETISNATVYEKLDNQGYIYFCVRFSVWQTSDTNEFDPMEVNFMETPVLLIVDLVDDFQISLSQLTNADLVVAMAEQGNAVLGYICDSDQNIVEESLVNSQGVSVKVCVIPTPQTLAEGAYLQYLESFSFTRGNVTQVAIEPGTEGVAANELTEVNCTSGSTVCSFETILNADFFKTAGIVRGDGLAFLQLGSGASEQRRSLAGPAATLQADPTRFRFELVALPLEDEEDSAHAVSFRIMATVAMAVVFFLVM